jgi:signal transduction histidine kinase
MSADEDTFFARVVSLACHDLRTPLATVLGFARTLERSGDLQAPADRYVQMIDLAAEQIAGLLDDLSLAARIEAGRWDPVTALVPVEELVNEAAERGSDDVEPGSGGIVRVDPDAAVRALAALAHAARRHGGVERMQLRADGDAVLIAPLAEDVAPIVLADDLRDLGAAVGVRIVRALGGEVEADGEALRVRLPVDVSQ